MLLRTYQDSQLFVWGIHYQLGRLCRNLNELKAAQLLRNSTEDLAKMGYQSNCGVRPEESLLTLAAEPLAHTLALCKNPRALVFHHSYADSAVQPWSAEIADVMSRGRYFPASLMDHFKLDHLPYLGSFASGCAGFLSLLLTAGGLLNGFADDAIVCLTADVKPSGTTYDALREKILTSDCCSGFILGRQKRGYQLLGIGYYSTIRTLVPLVEIVKRTVQMVRELAAELDLDLSKENTVAHYPNIFPDAWKMVTHYLQIRPEHHVLDGLPERAHCLSSDCVITLAKWHQCREGRLHLVVNFGSGLHLGICILREEKNNAVQL